uniref:Uncharacterized protein n=1 Tax=Cacopsylla melanoneura TaxID=428564 RepID=A0A8D8T697_9HEMI
MANTNLGSVSSLSKWCCRLENLEILSKVWKLQHNWCRLHLNSKLSSKEINKSFQKRSSTVPHKLQHFHGKILSNFLTGVHKIHSKSQIYNQRGKTLIKSRHVTSFQPTFPIFPKPKMES